VWHVGRTFILEIPILLTGRARFVLAMQSGRGKAERRTLQMNLKQTQEATDLFLVNSAHSRFKDAIRNKSDFDSIHEAHQERDEAVQEFQQKHGHTPAQGKSGWWK